MEIKEQGGGCGQLYKDEKAGSAKVEVSALKQKGILVSYGRFIKLDTRMLVSQQS